MSKRQKKEAFDFEFIVDQGVEEDVHFLMGAKQALSSDSLSEANKARVRLKYTEARTRVLSWLGVASS